MARKNKSTRSFNIFFSARREISTKQWSPETFFLRFKLKNTCRLYHTPSFTNILYPFFLLVAWCRWNIRTRPSDSLISWSSYPSFQQETVRNADLVRELLGHWKVAILSRQLFQPSIFQGWNFSYRIGSMYDIFIIFLVNAGKYTIHGSSGYVFFLDKEVLVNFPLKPIGLQVFRCFARIVEILDMLPFGNLP